MGKIIRKKLRNKFIDVMSRKSSTRQYELGENENGLGRLKRPFYYFGNYPGIAHNLLLEHKHLYFEADAYDLFATIESFLFGNNGDFYEVTDEGNNWDKIGYIPEYDNFLETYYLLLYRGWVKEDNPNNFDDEIISSVIDHCEVCIDKTFDRLVHQNKKKTPGYRSILGKYLRNVKKEERRLNKDDIYKISEEYFNLDREEMDELIARIYKIAEVRSKDIYLRDDYERLANL
ncbi:MAG: hypothetical protein KAT28_00165 [Candidatus Aenigmarchaeota archaeon]|nr:hypothetical protein [Candidatus Aenigmarchaeota archaeon]